MTYILNKWMIHRKGPIRVVIQEILREQPMGHTVGGTGKKIKASAVVPALRQGIDRQNLRAAGSMVLPCGFSFPFFVTGAKEGAWAFSVGQVGGVCSQEGAGGETLAGLSFRR